MAKYDSEDLLDSIKQIMLDGLNTKIAAIEAEKTAAGKGLTPTLAQVLTDSYFCQTWNEKILNANPAVFYGIEDVQAVQNAGAVAKTYKIFCEMIFVDSGINSVDGHKRVARYSRALEEVFNEAYAPAIPKGRVAVEQIRPISFKLEEDSDEEMKIGGVSLTVTLV